ncbi:MAG TPA: ATP synthase F1 subunit delta, partial [Flavisolibacter sp.]
MQNPRLATRYAKSLIDLAIEKDQLDQVYADMLYLQQLTANRELVNLLRSPVVPSDKKLAVITSITGNNIGTLTAAFIKLLITKGRESDLPVIATTFIAQYKVKKGIHVVKLTTATPVSADVRNRIIEQVR